MNSATAATHAMGTAATADEIELVTDASPVVDSVLVDSPLLAPPPVPLRPRREELRPLEFTWLAFRLVASLLWEGIYNIAHLVVYVFRRRRARQFCARAVAGRSRSGAPYGLVIVSLVTGLLAGCKSIERDLEQTVWSARILAGTGEGAIGADIESFADTVRVLVEGEPVEGVWWSFDKTTGVTEIVNDSRDLVWTIGVLGDCKSDSGNLWETLTVFAN